MRNNSFKDDPTIQDVIIDLKAISEMLNNPGLVTPYEEIQLKAASHLVKLAHKILIGKYPKATLTRLSKL